MHKIKIEADSICITINSAVALLIKKKYRWEKLDYPDFSCLIRINLRSENQFSDLILSFSEIMAE